MPASVAAAAAASVRTPSWTGAPRPHAVCWRQVRRAVAEPRAYARRTSPQLNRPHRSSNISAHQSDSLLLSVAAAAASLLPFPDVQFSVEATNFLPSVSIQQI